MAGRIDGWMNGWVYGWVYESLDDVEKPSIRPDQTKANSIQFENSFACLPLLLAVQTIYLQSAFFPFPAPNTIDRPRIEAVPSPALLLVDPWAFCSGILL